MATNGKVSDGKEDYRSEDIQGDVLPGFRSRQDRTFHQRFLMLQIAEDVQQARNALRRLLDERIISTGRDVARSRMGQQEQAFVNVAFTATGLDRLGRRIENAAFTSGLAERSIDQSLLGDPADWTIGGAGQVIDVVINVGSTDKEQVEVAVERVVGELHGPGYRWVSGSGGELLPEGREHFGFKDGLAQPFATDNPAAVRASRVRGASRPARAKWPNWKALGTQAEAAHAEVKAKAAEAAAKAADEELQRLRGKAAAAPEISKATEYARQQATRAHTAAEAAREKARKAHEKAGLEHGIKIDILGSGVPMLPVKQFVVRDDDDFTRNGSYMVWLKLEQRPAEFWAMCRRLAARLTEAFGHPVDENRAAALLVGRDTEGIPLDRDPEAADEDFSYYADPFGRKCPAGSHTRLSNPRDVETASAMILRRGIPYGPRVDTRDTRDDSERGLIFVGYQADIESQYERIQREFANADYRSGPRASRFPDALISQRGRDGSTVEIAHPSGRGSVGARLKNTWVVPHGGLYLFVPSMTALRDLCERR